MNKLFLYVAVSVIAITSYSVVAKKNNDSTTATTTATTCDSVMRPMPLGDFEVITDPEDAASLLLISNDGENTSGVPVIVYDMDGTTGEYQGTSTTVASKHVGLNRINGPEFMYHSDRGLGALYAGPEGVHANWRIAGQWGFDVNGVPFSGEEPPALPGTEVGAYPCGTVPIGLQTHCEFITDADGIDLSGVKVGGVAEDVMTDLPAELALEGYDIVGTPAFHPAADGYIIFAACQGAGQCALYEVGLNGEGKIDSSSLLRLTPVNELFSFTRELAAGIHPLTNNLVVFGIGGHRLEIWESTGQHQEMNELAVYDSLPFRPQHLRITSSDTALYLHILDKIGRDRGSYLTVYDTSLHETKFISKEAGGAELVWMPMTNRLALFYKDIKKNRLQRCWVE